MSKIIPLISSAVSGPLGIIHLPRLWSKLLLGAKGLLPEDYDMCGKGFDQMTLDALGIDRDDAINYVKANLPSYVQFEAWILEKKGGSIDKAVIESLNAAIRGYNHGEAVRKSILDLAGLPDDGSIKDAVSLNNLEDWAELHKQVVA